MGNFNARFESHAAAQIGQDHYDSVSHIPAGETDPENYSSIDKALVGDWENKEQKPNQFGESKNITVRSLMICTDQNSSEYSGVSAVKRTDKFLIDGETLAIKDFNSNEIWLEVILTRHTRQGLSDRAYGAK